MREIVHIQGGQCGNQIGAKFKEDAWSMHEVWKYRWTVEVWTYTDNHKKLITIVKDNCPPKSGGSEPKVFYLKIIGDYYRYTVQDESRDKLAEVTENANKYTPTSHWSCWLLQHQSRSSLNFLWCLPNELWSVSDYIIKDKNHQKIIKVNVAKIIFHSADINFSLAKI